MPFESPPVGAVRNCEAFLKSFLLGQSPLLWVTEKQGKLTHYSYLQTYPPHTLFHPLLFQ